MAAWCEVVWEVKWEQGGIDSGVAVSPCVRVAGSEEGHAVSLTAGSNTRGGLGPSLTVGLGGTNDGGRM